jgi:hypothetical protein
MFELKIDIDGKFHEKQLTERLMLLRRIFQMKNIKIDKKKTKHGYHLRISFDSPKQLGDRDIIFGQLICMSDYRREIFNFLRAMSGCKHYNALFNSKCDNNNKLLSCEKKI